MSKRGKPAWEKMTIEDGEMILKLMRGCVENLERCLVSMQKLNVPAINAHVRPLMAKPLPYVAEWCEAAASRVQRTAIEMMANQRPQEEVNQEKYLRQKKAKRKRPQ